MIALPTGMAAASQPLPDPLPQPIDGCVADPASCLPEAPAVDGCLNDPASCLPPAPEVDPCLEDPASCLPPAPEVDPCLDDPAGCLPSTPPVESCTNDPATCLEAVLDEEDPGKGEDLGKGEDDDEVSAAPVKGPDPKGRSKAVSGISERDRDPSGPQTRPSATALHERPTSNVAAGPEGILDRIGRGITDAAQRFAFPLAVAGLVAAFVLVQGRIDRRDPKLAAAPIDSRDDVVEFR